MGFFDFYFFLIDRRDFLNFFYIVRKYYDKFRFLDYVIVYMLVFIGYYNNSLFVRDAFGYVVFIVASVYLFCF